MTASVTFDDWLDDFFATLFAHRTVDATFVGVHKHDAAMPDFSDAGVAAQIADLDRLGAALPTVSFDEPTRAALLDRQVAEGYLASQSALWRSDHAPHRDPAAIAAVALLGVIGLLRRDFAPVAQRLGHATTRSRQIPEMLTHAARAAASAPPLWSETAKAYCRAGQKLFGAGIPRFCADRGLAVPDEVALQAAASAFASLGDALGASEQAQRRQIGCGTHLLDTLLEQTHHVPGGSATVEDMAVAELDSARDALEAGAREFGTDWRTVMAELAADRVPIPRLVDRHREVFELQRKLVIENELLTWPEYPVTFLTTPPWLAGVMADAMVYPYHAAPPFDPDVPVDFIIPESKDGIDETTILTNHVLHHAGVGHHVQNWFAYNVSQSRIGRLAAVDSAGYILLHSGIGMAEGWSGYVPGMIAEFGLLDAQQRLSVHHDRLRAATRALVDVRLHTGRWSVEDAARFVAAETGAHEPAALAAVQRISHAPSSGSMYLVGPTLIRRLRTALVGARPTAGELGRFHDALLSFGSLPMPLIAATMTNGDVDLFV
ncbi:MAG: DUF885 family protein [Pseudomonadota bacterium]